MISIIGRTEDGKLILTCEVALADGIMGLLAGLKTAVIDTPAGVAGAVVSAAGNALGKKREQKKTKGTKGKSSRVCVVCGKTFAAPLRSNAKTCSPECKQNLRLKSRAANTESKPPAPATENRLAAIRAAHERAMSRTA